MSGFILQDGLTGETARVDPMNRLRVFGDVRDLFAAASAAGRAFQIPTDVVALNTGGVRALLYVKNNDSRSLFLEAVRVSGNGAATVRLLRNPTGGTIVSAGQSVAAVNSNYGQSLPLTGDLQIAATPTQDFTDGELFTQTIEGGAFVRTLELFGGLIIPQSRSLGVTVEPGANGNFAATVIAYYQE